jgi:DNA mismatch endonuclease, patch repair protein
VTDIVDRATRSRMMAGIGGKDTKPEITVRRALHSFGLRFRLHRAGLPGRPDVVLPRHKAIVFVHGCFWHRHAGCRYCYTPRSNLAFWKRKFQENVQRDIKTSTRLRRLGWRVFVMWECNLTEQRLLTLGRRIRRTRSHREPSRRRARTG